ncbi:hypothetical protein KY290_017284 [Solanum tuberosum]|uniref:Uncharacterized protein n=1 Tax=Solanum tuberosum TaxID=4113 RepID=A0ABQ7VCR6_SOLTU|nr:hypothetical protein KY290_017284 [Solanum tuberosum]
MANCHAKNVPPLPPPPPQSPPPSSRAHSPPCVRKEATPTADAEILGVYESSAPIHSVNDPPRKRGSMLNAGEGTSVVRAKRPNVEAFLASAGESVNIGPFVPNLKCFFPTFNMFPHFLGALTEWMEVLLL